MDHDRAKRVVELVLAPILIVLVAPILALIALSVWVSLGRPILYRGPRVGKHEKVFDQYKFRTMTNGRDASGRPLPDGDRITPFGRILRRFSLDELPQLFNILLGHMSFIGPRPLPCAYLPRYSSVERRRHEVRPGLTGLAQAKGRNEVGWPERFILDVAYVDRASFRLDAAIVLRTAWLVLSTQGISAAGHATAPEFVGSDPPDGGLATAPARSGST